MFLFNYIQVCLGEITMLGVLHSMHKESTMWSGIDRLMMPDVSVTIRFNLVPAGHYDGSRDGVGMHIGEGWIPYGWTEVDIEDTYLEIEYPCFNLHEVDSSGYSPITGNDMGGHMHVHPWGDFVRDDNFATKNTRGFFCAAPTVYEDGKYRCTDPSPKLRALYAKAEDQQLYAAEMAAYKEMDDPDF